MGLAAYTAAVLADSPTAYWKLDDVSGLPQDSSGNGLHMTSSTIDPSHYQNTGPFSGWTAIRFTASEFASRAAVSSDGTTFSLEMWLQIQVTTADNQSLFGNASASKGWTLLVDNNDTLQAVSQGVGFLLNGATSLTTNDWYHVVITKRADTSWWYFLNGVADPASNRGTTTVNAAPTTTTVHAATNAEAAYSQIAYYDTDMSDATITAHYNAALASEAVLAAGIMAL